MNVAISMFIVQLCFVLIGCKPDSTSKANYVINQQSGKGQPMVYVTYHPDGSPADNGGKQRNLIVYLYDGSSFKTINAWSGRAAEKQKYRKASESVANTMEPTPEGYYALPGASGPGTIDLVGDRFFEYKFSGPTKSTLKANSRTALGFHTYNDSTNSLIPRSKGCLVFKLESELDQLESFLRENSRGAGTVPMIVDWKIGSVKIPNDLATILDVPQNSGETLVASNNINTVSDVNPNGTFSEFSIEGELKEIGFDTEGSTSSIASTTGTTDFGTVKIYCTKRIQQYIDWGFGESTLDVNKFSYCSYKKQAGMDLYYKAPLKKCLIEHRNQAKKADASCQASRFLVI